MATIIQISDTHFSRNAPEHEAAWHAAGAYIRARKPDLVIHTGDIVHDETCPDDRAYALERLGSLGVDWLAIPGNHDIGDGPPNGATICPDRVRSFTQTFGTPRWSRQIGGWKLIGVNAMLFGSGTDDEREEWQWLEGQIARADGVNLMLFVHKPPFIIAHDEPQNGSAAMPRSARDRFWSAVKASQVRLVACGHRHEYRVLQYDGVSIIWAPTTSTLQEHTPPFPSDGCVAGLVEYVISGHALMHRLVRLQALVPA